MRRAIASAEREEIVTFGQRQSADIVVIGGGIMMTPDAHPIAGSTGPAGLHVVSGFSDAGFKKGPGAAEAMADSLLGGGPDWVDLTPFRPERFASDAWRAPWGEDECSFRSDFGHGQ